MKRTPASVLFFLGVVCSPLLFGGCVERTIRITSTPPGALVYLNDEEVGRTPCRTEFTHYGTYDVRLVLDGYEPYLGPGEMDTPLHQWPVFDLVAEILPLQFRDTVEWHFDLREVDDDPAAMLDRALQLRARLHEGPRVGAGTAEVAAGGESSAVEDAAPPAGVDGG